MWELQVHNSILGTQLTKDLKRVKRLQKARVVAAAIAVSRFKKLWKKRPQFIAKRLALMLYEA
ncbi:MAG: hypothetical protein ACE5J2_00450 [Nitrososphaerales archaeon]